MDSLKPCRACGAPCRIEIFEGEHVTATLWMCSQHVFFRGKCSSEVAYLTEDAWNTRSPNARNEVLEEAARVVEQSIFEARTGEIDDDLRSLGHIIPGAIRAMKDGQ